MPGRFKSRLKTFGLVLSWIPVHGIFTTYTRLKAFRGLSQDGFDKAFYQKEAFALDGIHPIIHYLDRGKDRGLLPESPQVQPAFKWSTELSFFEHEKDNSVGKTIKALSFRPLDICTNTYLRQAKVGIVMPCLNVRDTVCAAIDSVLKQLHQDWILIIVDDGSEDDSVDKIELEFGAEIEEGRIELIRESHIGVSAARNKGLEKLLIDHPDVGWVAYLDSDNSWYPDHLTVHVKALFNQNQLWSYGAMLRSKADEQELDMPSQPYNRPRLLQENWIDLNTLVHHVDCISRIGGFDTRLRRLVDYDLALRLGRLGLPAVVTKPTVNYTIGTDSISSREKFLPARNRVRFNHICERISWGLERPTLYIEVDKTREMLEPMSSSGYFNISNSPADADICLTSSDRADDICAKTIRLVSTLSEVPAGAEEGCNSYILLSPPNDICTADDIARLAKCFCVSVVT